MNALFFFRDTADRRDLLSDSAADHRDCTPLLGYDQLASLGWSLQCNLDHRRKYPRLDRFIGKIDPWYARKTGTGLGDIESAWSWRKAANNADVVISTSCFTGLPLAHMRRYGLLKRPHIYLSIGLPERLKNMARINPRAHRRYMDILSAVDHFIAFGWAEATELRNLFTKPVSFIPFGVNTHFFHPNHPPLPTSVDILSIGADSQRDFPILLEFAKRNPHRSIQMIVSGTHANQLKNHPPNIKLAQALPISDVCSHIASARLIVLPVRENTYSGATTTLLQCMAMEKAVVVSRVGAIRDGYGFKDGVNLRFVEPSDISEMSRVINEMLAQDVQNAMMPKAARLHVQGHLNWQQFVESMNQVMRLVAQL